MQALDRNGNIVKSGDIVKDFRNQEWIFVKPTRREDSGRTGKVLVKDEFNRTREFYQTVFDFKVVA